MEVYYKGKVDHHTDKYKRDFRVLDNGEFLEWELTQGLKAFVDYEDFESLTKLYWRAQKDHAKIPNWYALGGSTGGNYPVIGMHRFIANDPPFQVDHRNLNSLDNRRVNLRLATKEQQMFNQYKNGGGKSSTDSYSSSYRGVTFRKDVGKFRVRAQGLGGIQHNVGHFKSDVEAAKAWDDFMFKEYKNDFPLKGVSHNKIVGEPTINFIRFNFPERLGLTSNATRS